MQKCRNSNLSHKSEWSLAQENKPKNRWFDFFLSKNSLKYFSELPIRAKMRKKNCSRSCLSERNQYPTFFVFFKWNGRKHLEKENVYFEWNGSFSYSGQKKKLWRLSVPWFVCVHVCECVSVWLCVCLWSAGVLKIRGTSIITNCHTYFTLKWV